MRMCAYTLQPSCEGILKQQQELLIWHQLAPAASAATHGRGRPAGTQQPAKTKVVAHGMLRPPSSTPEFQAVLVSARPLVAHPDRRMSLATESPPLAAP